MGRRSSWIVVWCALVGARALLGGAVPVRASEGRGSPLGALALAPGALPAEPPAAEPAFPDFRVGEELVYKARVWKGFGWIGATVGDAVLSVGAGQYEGRGAWRLEARAQGGAFGYDLTSDITSYLAMDDGSPLHYSYSQSGSDMAEKRLEFSPGHIEYWKRKHCQDKSCHNPDHFVKDAHGRLHHCDDRDCELSSHQVWTKRWDHCGQGGAYDMLSALYLVRSLDLSEGHTLRVVEGDQIFDVTIEPVGEEWVRTDAGSFYTACMALEPQFVSGDPPKKASKLRGVFGLGGTIRVWIDKATGAPVKLRGKIPFGVDLNGEVDLVARRTGR
jgi:hypothetical protein